jgi:DmsE family decaheme c-type cytochrome
VGAAAEPEVLAAVAPSEELEYAGGGVETCIDCHDESERYPVLSILKTKHGMMADLRTPLGSDTACETCHGPSVAHEEDSEDVKPAILFGRDAPAGPQNDVCMGCHQSESRINWLGSAHDSQKVACVSCHTIHAGEDPVLSTDIQVDRWNRGTQADVCFTCHTDKKAESYRLSTHPIKQGKAMCSGCHVTHGSMGPKLLARPTVNETCFTCHADKRGPFLWEHAPAREDCGTCHDTHGTNHRPMLVARGPWLCQQCHMASYHPSTPYTGGGIVQNGGADNKLLSKECRNCHDEVHGSNHPSGVRWTR